MSPGDEGPPKDPSSNDHGSDEPLSVRERLFREALRLPAPEREAFLEGKAEVDEVTIAFVRRMIAAHESGADPLQGSQIAILPEKIGPFEVLELLGEGGMGVVYLGYDPRLERKVAIKVPNPRLAGAPLWMERFLAEARTLGRFSHPHIAGVHETSPEGEEPWVAMEYVEGPTLREDLEENGPFPPEDAIECLIHLADGLSTAHRNEILHRDLKPENIILSPTKGAVILDFGIAKAWSESERLLPTEAPRTTPKTTAFGTPDYASPEQLRREPVDARTDIWGLGSVAFECLTAERPFPKRNGRPIPDPPAFDRLPGGTPSALTQLIKECVEPEQGDRPESTEEVVRRLEEIRDWDRLRPRRRRFLTLATLAGTAVAILGTLLTWTPWRSGEAATPLVPPLPLAAIEKMSETSVRGLDREGSQLWVRDFGGTVLANLGTKNQRSTRPFCVFATAEGKRGIVAVEAQGLPCELHLLDGTTGADIWKVQPRSPRAASDPGWAQRFVWEAVVELEGHSEPVILAHVRQTNDTSSIEYLNLDGDLIGLYLAPAHLLFSGQHDLDGDGRKEIYLCGSSIAGRLLPGIVEVADAGNCGTVIVLPPEARTGQGFPYSPVSRPDWPDQPRFQELRHILIPPAGEGTDTSVRYFKIGDDSTEIHTHDGSVVKTDGELRVVSVHSDGGYELSPRTYAVAM